MDNFALARRCAPMLHVITSAITFNAIICKCDFEQEAVLVITNYTVIIQPECKSL